MAKVNKYLNYWFLINNWLILLHPVIYYLFERFLKMVRFFKGKGYGITYNFGEFSVIFLRISLKLAKCLANVWIVLHFLSGSSNSRQLLHEKHFNIPSNEIKKRGIIQCFLICIFWRINMRNHQLFPIIIFLYIILICNDRWL